MCYPLSLGSLRNTDTSFVFDWGNFNKNLPEYSVALAVGIPDGQQNQHCGIIFKVKEGVKFLHFAWHCQLCLDDESKIIDLMPKLKYVEFVRVNSKNDPSGALKMSIIGFARTVFNKHKASIPYATLFHDTTLNKNDNDFIWGKNEFGLTCATFILAFFRAVGIDLIDVDSWKSRKSDKNWHSQIVALLEKYEADKIHTERVRNERDCARYRPVEVVASSYCDTIPSKFKFCKDIGNIIQRCL